MSRLPFGADYPWRTSYDADFDICGFERPQLAYRQIVWGSQKTYIASRDPRYHGQAEKICQWGWPLVHHHWSWPGCEGMPTTLEVYSPAEEVELLLNGASLGRKRAGADHRYKAEFTLTYQPGRLEAVSYIGGQPVSRDALETAGVPDHLALLPETDSLTGDGQGLCFIRVEVQDRMGRRVPTAEVPPGRPSPGGRGAAGLRLSQAGQHRGLYRRNLYQLRGPRPGRFAGGNRGRNRRAGGNQPAAGSGQGRAASSGPALIKRISRISETKLCLPLWGRWLSAAKPDEVAFPSARISETESWFFEHKNPASRPSERSAGFSARRLIVEIYFCNLICGIPGRARFLSQRVFSARRDDARNRIGKSAQIDGHLFRPLQGKSGGFPMLARPERLPPRVHDGRGPGRKGRGVAHLGVGQLNLHGFACFPGWSPAIETCLRQAGNQLSTFRAANQRHFPLSLPVIFKTASA